MRTRLESPAGPGALFGSPAPSEAELAAAKHHLDCTLACIPEDDLPPVPTALPPDTAAAAALRTAQLAGSDSSNGTPTGSTATAKRASTVGPKVPGAAGGGVAGGGKGATLQKGSTVRTSAVGSGLAVAGAGEEFYFGDIEPDPVDWRSVQTWAKLEGLLDVHKGGEVVDGPLAAYLAQLFSCQKEPQQGLCSTVGR
jgi:hypothetical protein